MKIVLGLGSNLGDRRENLRAGLAGLEARGIAIKRVSPVVESPALLPADAPADWNRPFLNLVTEVTTELSPLALLEAAKQVETAAGRQFGPRWAPRPIDIDILLFGQEVIHTDALQVPHPGIAARPFVLSPLLALDPGLVIPGDPPRSVMQLAAQAAANIPLWMGIINVTPDSFSDGGLFNDWQKAEQAITEMLASGAQYIDLGAESTRPGAEPVDTAEEWRRLESVLLPLLEQRGADQLFPRISIDTYHPDVAEKAMAAGVDLINDVSGLSHPGMLALAAGSDADWVAMHQVTLPADPAQTIPVDVDPAATLQAWLEAQLERWTRAGVDLDRVIFDPGIGFGKTALQSQQILQRIGQFRGHGLRILVGHSRKSYMRSFATSTDTRRDLATIGASLSLASEGVDILRVHNIPDHVAAWLGWVHVRR